MQRKDSSNDDLLCSFCGKSQDEVKKLIAGPSVYICDECIQLCNEIIAEDYGQEVDSSGAGRLPKPFEIKEILQTLLNGTMSKLSSCPVSRYWL